MRIPTLITKGLAPDTSGGHDGYLHDPAFAARVTRAVDSDAGGVPVRIAARGGHGDGYGARQADVVVLYEDVLVRDFGHDGQALDAEIGRALRSLIAA